MKDPYSDKWPNFTKKERSCRCRNCLGPQEPKEMMNHAFMTKIQLARTICGISFHVRSSYRCEQHLIERQKKKTGSHCRGLAIDLGCSHTDAHTILAALNFTGTAMALLKAGVSIEELKRLFKESLRLGFKRYGIQQKGDARYIHVDDEGLNGNRHIYSYK